MREDIVMNLESLVIYFGAFYLLDPWEYGLQTWNLMLISSAEIELTLCHLTILENDAPLELLRDALLFGKFSQLLTTIWACSKWNFASTLTESGKPRRDLSTIAWKSLYKFAVTRTPRATWVPIWWCTAMLKKCSEMRLAGETVIMDLWSQYTRNPKCLRVMLSVSLLCEQSTDSFFPPSGRLFQLNFLNGLSIDHGIPWFEIESHERIPFLPSWLLDA